MDSRRADNCLHASAVAIVTLGRIGALHLSKHRKSNDRWLFARDSLSAIFSEAHRADWITQHRSKHSLSYGPGPTSHDTSWLHCIN